MVEFDPEVDVEPAEANPFHEDAEPWQVCCPSPQVAAARLCGCGGQPYV